MPPPAPPPLYRDFATQAEIDAQYDDPPAIDLAAELRHYVAAAAQARETLPCRLDLPYGPTRAETLDIYLAARADAPVFVFFHGGYWRALSSREFGGVALGLQPLGITTVVPNYALCPAVSLDEVVRQARAALAWVWREAPGFGADRRRIAVGGHSAGAQLAAMCLATRWADDYGLPEAPLRAALLASGIYDLEPLRWSWLQPVLQLDEGLVRRNSPLATLPRCAAEVLVTWGADESAEFARQSQAFHDAWQAAGNRSQLLAQAGAHHYTAIHGLEEPGSPLCRWLADQLQPGEAR